MARGQAALLQVLLVVFFGRIEGGGGVDFGDDGPVVLAARFKTCLRGEGGVALLRAVVEDRRAVLRAYVRPLAVEGGGVVVLPEDLKQLLIADARGVVYNLDRFGDRKSTRLNSSHLVISYA